MLRLNVGRPGVDRLNAFITTGPAFDIHVFGQALVPGRGELYPNLNANWIVGGGVEVQRVVVEARFGRNFREINIDTRFREVATIRTFAVMIGARFN